MTQSEIELFKKFMLERKVYLGFLANYRGNRLTINPDDLEVYLERARAENVITMAFCFTSNRYARDFWMEIQEDWLEALAIFRNEEQNKKCIDSLDLEIIEFSERRSSLRLPKDTCSLNLKNNQFTLNVELSKMVAKKQSTKMMLTRSRQTMNVVLIFNRVKGLDVKLTQSRPGSTYQKILFRNVELADHLTEMLELNPALDYHQLSITFLAETKDNLLFLVKQK